MSFDINRLEGLDSYDDAAQAALDKYVDDLIDLFKKSPEGQAHLAIDDEMEYWPYQLMHFGFNFQDVAIPQMTAGDVREIVEEVFPAKVTLNKPEEAEEIIPALVVFWGYLQTAFELPKAKSILGYLRKIKPKYEKIMNDSSKFGMAKSMAMMMLEEGVDITDQEETDQFFARYNASMLGDMEEEEDNKDTIEPETFKTLEEKQKDYTFPVVELLTLGEEKVRGNKWLDYFSGGFEKEHVAELAAMAVDQDLYWCDPEGEMIWAPVHAWRALGQMKAEDAVEPLVSLFGIMDEYFSDWLTEEIPGVLGMIGPAAIVPVKKFLAEGGDKLWGRVAAAHALEEIGSKHYQARLDSVAALTGQLKAYQENDPTLNAFLISYLIDLKGLEALPVIEQAYEDDMVDISVHGDWEDVQIELGLLEKRITPAPRYHGGLDTDFFDMLASSANLSTGTSKKEDKKTKAKQKQQKKPRKKNRKRKKPRKRKKK